MQGVLGIGGVLGELGELEVLGVLSNYSKYSEWSEYSEYWGCLENSEYLECSGNYPLWLLSTKQTDWMKIIEGGFAPLQGGFAPACVIRMSIT